MGFYREKGCSKTKTMEAKRNTPALRAQETFSHLSLDRTSLFLGRIVLFSQSMCVPIVHLRLHAKLFI